ncbi:MAG: hypothetical protein Q8S73_25950 [Deltaproteobacteria bacterium]|nr:hypothetical protein [Myxococcales bacterium]MDP3217581.1 hypothetical protein [Deltaproteobacteria bacterium]
MAPSVDTKQLRSTEQPWTRSPGVHHDMLEAEGRGGFPFLCGVRSGCRRSPR